MQRLPFFLLLMCLVTGIFSAQAQQPGGRRMEEAPPVKQSSDAKRSFFRQVVSKVNIGLSSGYGQTLYRQDLKGKSVFVQSGTHFLVPEAEIDPGFVNRSYSSWLNDPQMQPAIPRQDDKIVSGDTTHLGLSGYGGNIPLNLSLHINLIERFKVGAGFSGELFSIRDLAYSQAGERLGYYPSEIKNAFMIRYYGMLGVRVSRWYFWDFSVDTQIGKKKFISQFNNDHISGGFYYNAGLYVEHHLSEYFRITLRPSLEWSAYNMNLPEAQTTIKTQTPALYFQAGINFNYPALPRCPINRCHIQLEHVHFGKEYRGQPLPRWQNPKYGQNHPELMRNKKRSKDDTEQRLQYKKKRRKKFLFW